MLDGVRCYKEVLRGIEEVLGGSNLTQKWGLAPQVASGGHGAVH